MLDILETQQIPGSFYLASSEVHAFQDQMVRMNQLGEIGLTAENDLLRRRVEIQTEVGIGQEKYADRLTAENDRLRNDVAVLADRLIPGGPR